MVSATKKSDLPAGSDSFKCTLRVVKSQTSSPSPNATLEGMSKSVRRLFEQFQPESYQLSLRVDSEAMAFTGHVVVTGRKTGRPSERLTFHQKGLKVTTASITKLDKKGEHDLPVIRINAQSSYDEVRLHSDEKIFPGTYRVSMEFSGKISRNMEGIYPCFFEEDGKEQKRIATQF
jgi:aminopeptidase N